MPSFASFGQTVAIAFMAHLIAGCSSVRSDSPAVTMVRQTQPITAAERGRLEAEADLGNSGAAFQLFLQYEQVLHDHSQAVRWLRKAAENGHVIAQYNLGSILINESDAQSKAEGVTWLEKSAASGDAGARWLLDNYRWRQQIKN